MAGWRGEGRVCSSLQIFNKLLLARLPHCNRSSGCKRQQSNIISFSFIIWWRLQVLQGASYNSYLVGVYLCKAIYYTTDCLLYLKNKSYWWKFNTFISKERTCISLITVVKAKTTIILNKYLPPVRTSRTVIIFPTKRTINKCTVFNQINYSIKYSR